jgi:hypothetical protein
MVQAGLTDFSTRSSLTWGRLGPTIEDDRRSLTACSPPRDDSMHAMRSVVTYLLIVVLLACPAFCLGEAVHTCAPPEMRSCCHACGCESSPQKEAPTAPREQDADCICNGAVVGVAKVDGPQIASGQLPPLDISFTPTSVCGIDQTTRLRICDARDLPSDSGRNLRALICVRLL